jgi:AcrR family transcriptional regulator
MPRISADSVPEHVARQEAAVIEAAIRLFNERGVRDVHLGDIAKEVGLARNSLYRYFPDKAHILAAWFRITIAPLVELSNEVAAADAPAEERLASWVDAQFGYLTDPEHAAMLLASNEMTSLPDDVRAELGAGHRELYASLATILRDAFAQQPDRDVEVVTMLVAAVVRSAAEQVRGGADEAAVRDELARATRSMVAQNVNSS